MKTVLTRTNLNLHNSWQTILDNNSSFEPAQIIVKGYEYDQNALMNTNRGSP